MESSHNHSENNHQRAVENLQNALNEECESEKNYYIRQALQILDVASVEGD